jgi:Holliday junction resolvase RusA-like endonuclease
MSTIDCIELTIAGTPRARPRARSGAYIDKVTRKARAFAYHPSKPNPNTREGRSWIAANAWHAAVIAAARGSMPPTPWTGPVRLSASIYFERPQRMNTRKWIRTHGTGPARHVARPDRDNLDKAILDPLKTAGLFKDDCQVCAGEIEKWYAQCGYGPGVIIVAERLKEDPCSC